MKIKRCFVLLAFSVSSSLPMLSQDSVSTDYPFLREVRLDCRVELDRESKIFSYTYFLHNDRKSMGSIQAFLVDISRLPHSVLLDTIGLRFAGSGLMERWFREDYPAKVAQIIPFGFPSLPRYWLAYVGNAPLVSVHTDTLELAPGESLGGFVMTSKGLPSIRLFRAEPYFNIYRFFPSLEDTTRTMTIAQMDSIREAVNFYGWTIGPTAPPVDLVPPVWIDTLLSYTRQSADRGWLGKKRDDDCDDDERPDDGIARNIEQRLEKAKRQLTRADSAQARKELVKLVQKVERIWKRSQPARQQSGGEEEKKDRRDKREKRDKLIMTSEAYALLKYNTEYLVDHLPERSRHGRR